MKYVKYYLLHIMMIFTMLMFAYAFAEFSMGRNTSIGMILLYIGLSIFYVFAYFFLRHQIRKDGQYAKDIFHLLQTEEIYNMLHIFNEKVGLAFTIVMGISSVLVYFLKH